MLFFLFFESLYCFQSSCSNQTVFLFVNQAIELHEINDKSNSIQILFFSGQHWVYSIVVFIYWRKRRRTDWCGFTDRTAGREMKAVALWYSVRLRITLVHWQWNSTNSSKQKKTDSESVALTSEYPEVRLCSDTKQKFFSTFVSFMCECFNLNCAQYILLLQRRERLHWVVLFNSMWVCC